MKWLVLGAAGTLGSEVNRWLRSQNETVSAFSHSELALENYPALEIFFSEHQPQIVVNCAAYNAVDQAEKNPFDAFLINAEAVLRLSRLAQIHDAILIHYSTDYVFDGASREPYTEASDTHPLSVYGQSKWLGEQAALCANPKSYVLRTAVVFGRQGSNFYTRFLQLAQTKKQIDMVDDLIGCPTPAESLARVSLALVQTRAPYGLYHAAGEAACSRYEFAQKIVSSHRLNVDLRPVATTPGLASAKRPQRVVIVNKKLHDLHLRLDSWQEGLEKIVKDKL